MKINKELEVKATFKNLVLRFKDEFRDKNEFIKHLRAFSIWIDHQVDRIDSTILPLNESLLERPSKITNDLLIIVFLDISKSLDEMNISKKLAYLKRAKSHYYFVHRDYSKYLSSNDFPLKLFKSLDVPLEQILKY